MDQQNIMFCKNQGESYNSVDLYLNNNIFFGYKDSYNYYDIDVKKIILFKKSHNEYIIRCYDVNKMEIVPLQLKLKDFFWGELQTFTNYDRVIPIYSDDKKRFKKCREIQNTITKLIGRNNVSNFVETTNNDDEFIMVDVHKNTSSVRDNDSNKLIIVLHSVSNGYPQTSLVQNRY